MNTEQCDRGVCDGVNVTILSETLEVVGLAESALWAVGLRKEVKQSSLL